MQRNPVKRGLVEQPEQWQWSSFRAYYYGERGLVRVNFQEWPLEIRARPVEVNAEVSNLGLRETWPPACYPPSEEYDR